MRTMKDPDPYAEMPSSHPGLDSVDAERIEEALQVLSAVSVHLNILRNRIQGDDARDYGDTVQELLSETIDELRQVGTAKPAVARLRIVS